MENYDIFFLLKNVLRTIPDDKSPTWNQRFVVRQSIKSVKSPWKETSIETNRCKKTHI